MSKHNPYETLKAGAVSVENAAGNMISAAAHKAMQIEHSVMNLFSPGANAMPTASSNHSKERDDDDQESDVDSDSEAAALAGANANWDSYYRDHPDQAPAAEDSPPSDGQPPSPRTRAQTIDAARQRHQANMAAFVDKSAAFGKTASSDDILKHFAGPNASPQQLKNLRAALDMIAASEGTIGKGNNGYNVKVGGGLREGNQYQGDVITLKNGTKSTAYGRYQEMDFNYYGHHGLKTGNGMSDPTSGQYYLAHTFGITYYTPAGQDALALKHIQECGAIDDFKNGHAAEGIHKIRHIYASLPGAGYGQRENLLQNVLLAYTNGGGQLIDQADIQLASAAAAHANYANLRKMAHGPKNIELASASPAPGKGRRVRLTDASHPGAEA